MSIAVKDVAQALSKLIQQIGTHDTARVKLNAVSSNSTPTDSPSPNVKFTEQNYGDVEPFSLEKTYSPEEIAELVGANEYQKMAIGLHTKSTATPR